MPTQLLSIGPVQTLIQNQVYALPASRVLLFTDGAAPTLQQANDVGMAAAVAVTLAGGQAELAGGFLRCTNLATCNVRLTKA